MPISEDGKIWAGDMLYVWSEIVRTGVVTYEHEEIVTWTQVGNIGWVKILGKIRGQSADIYKRIGVVCGYLSEWSKKEIVTFHNRLYIDGELVASIDKGMEGFKEVEKVQMEKLEKATEGTFEANVYKAFCPPRGAMAN